MSQQRDITVQEVGPRDGLQATKVVMPTKGKIAWIAALKAAGLSQIQVGSFVPPKLLPQMADTGDVVAAAKRMGGFDSTVLVPNLRGAEAAIAAGVDQINFVMSVSEPHNLNNVRKTREESLEAFAQIVKARNDTPGAENIRISGGLATCFGCTIQGAVPEREVLLYIEQMLALGADRIGLADTVGYGNPLQVRKVFTAALKLAGDVPVGAHFHDTRGMGIANCFAALEAGVATLDGCQGGLGGCPYAPGATGNVVTEDLVFMLHSMGVRTGIDLDKLLVARGVMVTHLGDEPTHGAYVKAGPPKGFVPPLAKQKETT
jgi:hydroxymethylglutaryl-CoA lyase